MASNLTVSWSPPPLTELNYTNCTAASAYVASSVTLNKTLDIGYYATFNFLRSLVPLNWTDYPSDGDLLLWFESWDLETDNEVFNKSLVMVEQCGRGICEFLPLEGDPDLAGIGVSLDTNSLITLTAKSGKKTTNCRYQMMVSYYLVAFLATLYPIVISLDSVVPFKASKVWRRVHSWFEQTLNTFLDASLLFSISMLLAAIYRFSSAYRHPNGEDNTFIYSLINAVTVSMFSVFPPLILQSTAPELRRRILRAILWFLVIAFVITLTILYYIWRGPNPIIDFFLDGHHLDDQVNRHVGQYIWLVFCDLTDTQLIQSLDCAIITAQVVLGLNLPSWFYLVYTIIRGDAKREDLGVPQDPGNNDLHQTQFESWKSYGKYARALNILICYVTMWLLLGTFTTIAVRLAVAMGPFGKDRRWSIGQILAMATFVPLIIDIGAIVLGKSLQATDLIKPFQEPPLAVISTNHDPN